MTTTNITAGFLPTKKDIIQRLFEQQHITFDEMWVLLQDNEGVKYIPMPSDPPFPNIFPPFYIGDPVYLPSTTADGSDKY